MNGKWEKRNRKERQRERERREREKCERESFEDGKDGDEEVEQMVSIETKQLLLSPSLFIRNMDF